MRLATMSSQQGSTSRLIRCTAGLVLFPTISEFDIGKLVLAKQSGLLDNIASNRERLTHETVIVLDEPLSTYFAMYVINGIQSIILTGWVYILLIAKKAQIQNGHKIMRWV